MAGVPRFTPRLFGTRPTQALAYIDDVVSDVVARRRAQSEEGDDLLGILLRSGLPDRVIRGEIIAFLLVAVDEPPSALAAAWYLLGRDNDVERRFHAELDAVVGERQPMLDDEGRLPYLDAVLRETLRLYPPARHIDRCPVEHVRLDGTELRAGSNVLVSPLVTHHDEQLYDRASEFIPERWLNDEGSKPSRGAYLPFGAGAHTCIGEPLARAIMTLTLATVGRHWRLRLDADAPQPVPRAPELVVTLERR